MSASMPSEENNIVAVVQVFRHGHRTPEKIYPNDIYDKDIYWPLDLGDLTIKGKQEMYALGQYTRKRYQNFLPDIYSNKNLRIYSTDYERCIISAQLYGAGLYPPIEEEVWNEDLKWNPIPVYVAEQHIIRGLKYFCPQYAKDCNSILDSLIENFKKDRTSEYISHHSGIELKSYIDFVYLFDTLAIQESLGLTLPEWTKKVYPDYLKNCHLNTIDVVCWTEKMKKLYVGPLFYEIIQYFEKMIEDSSSGPKLVAYSCHDVNIGSVLKGLGVYERHLPIYGCSIFFELRQRNGTHYLNIIYRQKENVPIRIPGHDFSIKFEDFKNVLQDCTVSKEEFYRE